jgi:ABC-type Zn uptake system ZnuABC Zn-binding protein ZnuA
MNAQWKRAMLTSLILIFSSLAGCLGDDADGESTANENAYGSVMVSTYHIGELVKAIAGDDVVLEYMSQDNIPVHDYEPSVSDLIRLENSDLFFYHGLGLEPWVESTLSSLGSKAPTSVQVHTMPSGNTALDYESMLVNNLCDLITEGPYEPVTLGEEDSVLPELHAEPTAHKLSFPEEAHHDEDDHDEDGHDEDDHDEDGHDEDGHDEDDHDDHDGHDEDDHDGHEDHNHLEAEETFNMTDCSSEAVVSIFHLEAGEYVLEFEEGPMDSFDIAILEMGGAHAHHDHGDHEGEEHYVCHDMSTHNNTDHATEEECKAAGHTWTEEAHDDDHDDHDDHDGHEDELTAEQAMTMGDADNDGNLSWDEFWTLMSEDDDHDEDGHDEDDHDEDGHDEDGHDEDDHDEDGHDDEMEFQMNFMMKMFNDSDADSNEMLNMEELENFIEAMESMEDDDSMAFELMVMMYDLDNSGELSFEEYSSMYMSVDDDHEDDHDEDDHDEDGHDEDGHDEDDHDDSESDFMKLVFDAMDADMNGNLSAEELQSMMGEEEEHHAAFASLHVRAEGEYGIALPHGVTMHILANGGHDDHGHDAHEEDAHDDDDHDEDGHDEEGHDEDNHDEESLKFDPHSWLDPVAFNAQSIVVMDALIAAFPEGESTFKANGADYSAELVALDTAYDAAFGTGGLCMTGGHEKKVSANHNAYSYLSVRYDIQFVTVHGIDPEGEPSPQDIANVVEFINEDGITVLFVEEYTDTTSVQSIVDATSVEVQTLYTMELAPIDSSNDYISMMESNLANLIAGMGC